VQRWLEQTFAALAIRPFRILWFGTLTSFLAFFMSTIVNSVVAFELTGTNRAVGLVIFAQGLAMFLLGPIGGAYADRWPKRRVVATGQGITALVFVALAAMVSIGAIAVWQLALGGFVMGACFAFMGPARQAFVVDLVPLENLGNAVALSQVANNASRVGGPALAGLLLDWEAVGAAGAYAAMAGLYSLSAASLSLLPRSFGRDGVATPVLADVVDGLRYVRDAPLLRILLIFFVLVMMTGFPYVSVMPGFVENQLGHEAKDIGLLMVAAAVGGLVTSLLVTRYADAPSARGIYSMLGITFGVALCGLALTPDYAWAVAISAAIGAANSGFQTLSNAVLLRATEPAYVGRVMSLTMMAFAGFGLMGLPIGLLADAIGERGSLVGMGLAVCTVAAVCWAALLRMERVAATHAAEFPAP
jgi:MFS family permease